MDYKDINNKDEFIKCKKSTLSKLSEFIDEVMINNYKKSALITYWLKDYTTYLKQEETFSSVFFPVYERGSVIQVNLGFNLGKEYGGLHYAIVLNKEDTKKNPVLTVVPISSIKANKKWHKTDVNLKGNIFDNISLKVDTIIKSLENQIKHMDNNGITEEMQKQIDEASDCLKMARKLQKGSFAICNQVTTIDKMRIKNPTKENAPLYNIKISEELLDEISDIITKNYIY